MKTKPYIIRGPYSVGSCVVKVTYDGKKYVIVKCMNAYQGLKRIEDGLNAFIRGGVNNPTGLYFHLFTYVKKHPHKKFDIEVLLESNSAYLLLKKEQEELDLGLTSKACLNNQTAAYLPAYNDEKKMYGGWIPPHAVLNYNNWMERRKKKK